MYKASEWQNCSGGSWYVADVQNLAENSGSWRNAAMVARMNMLDFIKLLVETYKVDSIHYYPDRDLLTFSWLNEHYSYAHKYLLWINKCGRNFVTK